jgi:hypothetical protein
MGKEEDSEEENTNSFFGIKGELNFSPVTNG